MSVSSFVYQVSMWESIIIKAKDWYTQFTTGHSALDISSSFANTSNYVSNMNHILSYDEYATKHIKTREFNNVRCLQYIPEEDRAAVSQFMADQVEFESQPENMANQYNGYLSYMNDNLYGSGGLSVDDVQQPCVDIRDAYMKEKYGEAEYTRIMGLISNAKTDIQMGNPPLALREQSNVQTEVDMPDNSQSSRELPYIDYGTTGQPVKETQEAFGRLLPSIDYGNAENELSLSK